MTIPDGFVQVRSEEVAVQAKNIDFSVDEFSPFANRHGFGRQREELIVDRYYGQAYHAMDIGPAAIYGPTAALPAYSGDSLANDGFLRVPFRRIPRRVVRGRAELEALLASVRSADENLRILLRGQSRERYVERSPETTQWLYGEDRVREPSLTTSAFRRTPALEHAFAEWTALLQVFIASNAAGPTAAVSDDFKTSFGLPLFALALAQHYGLPTSGLDVTTSLDVALFFALMRYDKPKGSSRATYTRATKPSEMPVVYVLAPSAQQQFDYERYRTEGFPSGRPDAQAAYFMHAGWGHAVNACARRIFLAVYLDPDGDFDPVPSASLLFPSADDDAFAAFLDRLDGPLPENLAQMLADGFYMIAPGGGTTS